MVDTLLEVGQSLLPFALTIVAVLAALSLTSRVLARQASDMSRAGQQVILLAVGATGVVAVVLSLPVDLETRRSLLGFLGLVVTALLTVSSTTFASNALAGLMLRGARRYRSGDFIEVDGYWGRVATQGLFQTEIQTEDSDIIILPNRLLATSPVKVVRADGTIISIEVSLGYEAPRPVVKDSLVRAAETVGLDTPFVQLRELGDFAVTYRIAGYLREVRELPAVRSRLRAAAMDALHAAGIEIVSPTFMNQRAVTESVVPAVAMPVGEPPPPHSAPSDLAFAEAEAASRDEEVRERLAEVDRQVAELKTTRKSANPEEIEDLDAELERLEVRQAYLRNQSDPD